MRLTFTLAFCSLALGCFGLERLLRGDPIPAALCHILATASGGYAAMRSDSRRLGRRLFHAALAACIPFFGGFTAFFLSEAVKRKRTGSLADEFAVYLNDAASFRESVSVNDADIPVTQNLAPLYDILIGNASESEQRIAVENLVSMETPAAVEILRRVVEADKGEGKFFAMTALGQMEDKLLGRLQREEEFIASGRDDGVTPILETVATYIDFIYYRIAVDARRADFLERASALLDMALKKDDCPDSAWLLLGRVKLMAKDGLAAMDCFNAYLRLHPNDPGGLIWRAEAWYTLGNYGQVRVDCRAATAGGAVPAGISASVAFWLGDRVEDGDDDPAAGALVLEEGRVLV